MGGKGASMVSEHEKQGFTRNIIDGSAVLGLFCIVVMMIWMTGDVIASFFHSSLPDTAAWTEVLNVIGFALPLAYVAMTKTHITVELFTGGGRVGRLRDIFGMILTFLFTGLLGWQLSIQAWRSTAVLESAVLEYRIFWYPAKIALALGFVSSAIIVLIQLIDALRRKEEG
jgi:TRAP-type C4-dicarboxylate transport system permease small subunit